MLAGAAVAEAAWRQPAGGPSPINFSDGAGVVDPAITAIGGTPHVAWAEFDGTVRQVRVARLNGAGDGWEQVVGGARPINFASGQGGRNLSITAIGGVAHVAWVEADGTNDEVRVARLSAAGDVWEQLALGPNPINRDAAEFASDTDIEGFEGVPHVAWVEEDGANKEIFVSRLNAAGNGWEPVGAGSSPVNHAPSVNVALPDLAVIGGALHVAWSEADATNSEVRVARFNAAANDWEELGGGASPINHVPDRSGNSPSLADVGGVPHVAWREHDGSNSQVRVSRFNPAASSWGQIVGGASPINNSLGGSATEPSLVAIGGVLYVAWAEFDGTNNETRVSRLNAAGDAWQQVVGGESPINESTGDDARNVSLVEIGGVPYVAWREFDGTNNEVRVSRLEPEILSASETFGDNTAALSAEVRTFGAALPIGFEYGPGAGFGMHAPPVTAESGNADSVTVTQNVSGLASLTDHSWRPFGTDGTRATVLGPTRTFRTTDTVAPVLSDTSVSPSRWAVNPRGAAETQASRHRAPRGTRIRFRLSEAARVVFTVERRAAGRRVGRTCRRPSRSNRNRRRCARHIRSGSFAHTGAARRNARRFSGRIGRRSLRPGRYRLTLVATDAAGNRSRPKRLGFTVVRR